MKIGIFGGSFDPVHTEHVCMASSAIDCLGLDKLYVVPAAIPPHKPWKRMTEDEVRLRALQIAFDGVKKAEISRYEIEEKGTSYTYLTCRRFRKLYPSAELYFLVGTDMLRDFPTWRYPEEILQNVMLAVCGRAEEEGWQEKELARFVQLFQKPFVPITYEGRAVSSTEIRVLLAAGESTQGMLAPKVEQYLKEKGVYEIARAKEALSLESPKRRLHSLRVAFLAASRAPSLGVDERRAIIAALFHDCAKNLEKDSPLLQGFSCDKGVPAPVFHQFSGAYVAHKAFGIEDEEVLDAIRYHTSGRANMSTLEKLIYLADALESGRDYDGVEELRRLFWSKDGLDECLTNSLKSTLAHVEAKGESPYFLTKEAYEYYQKETEKTNGGNQ
ncbi:MAG: nicotinate (nicotinamide) nucleotide adenylyltransferase [Clostridia bacterium]|nr:nicotinate (nicotinamide) nucleotide adenylyltransferase [Clostridia bacterium]